MVDNVSEQSVFKRLYSGTEVCMGHVTGEQILVYMGGVGGCCTCVECML